MSGSLWNLTDQYFWESCSQPSIVGKPMIVYSYRTSMNLCLKRSDSELRECWEIWEKDESALDQTVWMLFACCSAFIVRLSPPDAAVYRSEAARMVCTSPRNQTIHGLLELNWRGVGEGTIICSVTWLACQESLSLLKRFRSNGIKGPSTTTALSNLWINHWWQPSRW